MSAPAAEVPQAGDYERWLLAWSCEDRLEHHTAALTGPLLSPRAA
jgi:hypothetical protein